MKSLSDLIIWLNSVDELFIEEADKLQYDATVQKIKKLLKRKNVIFFLAYFGIFILLWTQPNFNESVIKEEYCRLIKLMREPKPG